MADTPKKTTKHHIDTNNLFVYLQTGRYLPGTNENAKRNLRKRAKSFKIIDEKLYYISCHSDNQGNAITAERLVIREKQEQMAIVAQLHVDDKGCHIGREKLTNKISEKYYFVGISTMVRDYISECTYCQIHRPSHRNSSDGNLSGSACSDAGDGDDSSNFSSSSTEESKPMTTEWMLSMQDPHRFWEIVEMNVIGPFSYDKSKYHIVVFMDVFSKWPEAYVVDTLTPSIITHLILNLVCRFGSMKTLTIKASQGLVMEDIYPREDILQKADLQINVNKQASSFSCPIWEEIKGSIQHFTDNNNQWPYCLEFALLPHRISRAESCEYTPSYITYGRELNLPPSLSHKDEDVSSNMFHAAEPHLTSAQMTSTRECLTEAYNMYGKFSEAAKPFCLTSSLTSLGKKQDSSNKTTVATSRRKRKSTFNVENIFKCDDSDDDITEKEIEEDMPPPSSASKEVLTGASKRKRSRRIRLIAQDSNDEDNPVEDKESKSQDDTKNVNYASGSKNEKAVEKQRRIVDTIQLKSPTKKYVCNVCHKEVSRSDVLRRHMREMHEVHESSVNICPECGICIKRKQHLKRHILKVHQNKSDNFDCRVCGKTFSQKMALKQHITTFHENELYNCEKCKRNYTTKSGLKVHIAQEHEQKYPCPVCGKCSGSSSLFNKHLATHQGNDIKCPHCKLSFSTKESFMTHRDNCRVAQQYTCIMCGKIFHSKNAFQQHEATHYDGKYPCHYCGLQFSFCTNLNRHLRTVHGRGGDKSDDPSSETINDEAVYSELISPASIRALLAQVSETTLKIPTADGSDLHLKDTVETQDDAKSSFSQTDSISVQEASKASSAIPPDSSARHENNDVVQTSGGDISPAAGSGAISQAPGGSGVVSRSTCTDSNQDAGGNGVMNQTCEGSGDLSQAGCSTINQPGNSSTHEAMCSGTNMERKNFLNQMKDSVPSQTAGTLSTSELWENSLGNQRTDHSMDEKGDLSSIHIWGNSLQNQNENNQLASRLDPKTSGYEPKFFGIQTPENTNNVVKSHNQLS